MDQLTESSNRALNFLMIDDDEIFGRVMQKKAASNGINLEYFSSLEKLGRVAFFSNYDVILLDYWMEDLNGREVAEYVTAFCPKTPVVLISSDNQLLNDDTKWPACIIERISKGKGSTFILRKTFELVSSFQQA